MTSPARLRWTHAPSLIYSDDHRYVIVPEHLPDPRSPGSELGANVRTVFVVRTAAHGTAIAEEPSLPAAQQAAHRNAHPLMVDPRATYASPELCRFWHAIPDDPVLGALAIVNRGRRLVAQVLSMDLVDGRYEPQVRAELDITAATRSPLRRAWYQRRRRILGRQRSAPSAASRAAGLTTFRDDVVGTAVPLLSWTTLDADTLVGSTSSQAPLSHDRPDYMYLIVRRDPPEQRLNGKVAYVVRVIHPAALSAYGLTAIPGDFLAERSTAAEARQVAHDHAADRAQHGSRDVPPDYPGRVLQRFPWRVPAGTGAFALTVVHEGERVLLRLMATRRAAGDREEQLVLKTVVLTELKDTRNTWESDIIAECGGCLAQPDTPHSDCCPDARCPECGRPRITCRDHSSPRASRWHGTDPVASLARKRGWLLHPEHPAHPGYLQQPVENRQRVRVALDIGMIAWDPDLQQFVFDVIDDDVLDRRMPTR